MRWKRHHFEYKNTIATIMAEPGYVPVIENSLIGARAGLETVLARAPKIKSAMSPVRIPFAPHRYIRNMEQAASAAGVGPMAAVAGAFAEHAVQEALEAGAREAVVDNGGDIALYIRETVHMGIYTGKAGTSKLAFRVEPREQVFGICTSSGTVGHSFSFGTAAVATVVSPHTALADAAATALGNRIRSKKDLGACFEFLEGIPGIEGALAVWNNNMALWGDLPEIVEARVDKTLITRGRSVYTD